MSATRLVEALFDVINGHGGRELVRRYDEFFTDRFEFRPALTGSFDGRVYVGKDAFVEYWDEFYGSFTEMVYDEMSFEEVSPGTVLVLGHMRVLGQESGVSLEQDVSFVCEVDDGGVSRATSYLTQAEGRKAAANA